MTTSATSSRRNVAGIALVDKPGGATSNRVLQTVKRLFNAAKAGHTGSLDPLATGMLPVCLGAATKISGMLLGARKMYRVTVALGSATDTGDADGAVVARRPVPDLTVAEVTAVLAGFSGEIAQVPPMYSALKQSGRRLYELARRGLVVERAPRAVTIYRLDLEALEWPRLDLVVECSKGTYVRSLAADIAAGLGTVGHVVALRRLAVDPYTPSQMMTLERLEALAAEGLHALDAVLLPADSALVGWPMLTLDADRARCLRQGQRVPADASWPTGAVRLYAPERGFMGVGSVLPSGELKAERLFLV